MIRYSYSSLDTFRNCPQKFKFQYVDKVQVPKKVSADAYLGNAVHRVLQQLYMRGSNGVLTSFDETLHLYNSEWEKVDKDVITVVSDYMGVDDYQRLGREMLQKHYDKYQPFNQGTLLGTELNLSCDLPSSPYRLTARVDRLWKHDDGVVEICDFKTGQHLTRPNDPAFFYQMGLYQLAVLANYPQFTEIESAQYFLRMDEVVRYRFSADEIEQLTEDLRVSISTILYSRRMDDFPTKEGPLCKYCDFEHLCPARRHRIMLEEETIKDDERPPAQIAYEKATEYLEKYQQKKILEGEMDALKRELIQLAVELNVNKFRSSIGDVTVKTKREEKFITKTEDAHKFAELSALTRRLGLDEYFILDGRALMKEAYSKQRLKAEVIEQLQPYVVERISSRVTAKLTDPVDDEQ